MKIVSLKKIAEEPVTHNPDIKKKVMIRKGEVPKLTNFSRSVFAPGQVAPLHRHENMYEVFFVEGGTAGFLVNGSRYVVSKGECVTIAAGDEHEVSNAGEHDLVLIYFGIEL